MSELDIDLESYCIEEKDIASLNFDSSYCSKTEIEEITIDFDIEKSQICEECKSELYCCKNDVVEEGDFIKNDEKENLIGEQNLQTILHWKIEQDWSVNFDFWWKNLFFYPTNTNEYWVGSCKDLQDIKTVITITTLGGNYAIKDGVIYDWNKSINSYLDKIGKLSELVSDIRVISLLQKTEPSPLSFFTVGNFKKNTHILECALGLLEAKQSLNKEEKYDFLLRAMEHLNLTYEEKIYFDKNMNSEDLSEVIEWKLIKILERWVFVK